MIKPGPFMIIPDVAHTSTGTNSRRVLMHMVHAGMNVWSEK